MATKIEVQVTSVEISKTVADFLGFSVVKLLNYACSSLYFTVLDHLQSTVVCIKMMLVLN